MKPARRPDRPWFSSGPTAKRPGWRLEALPTNLLGRGIRDPQVVARFEEGLALTRAVLAPPDDHVLVYIPGSDTGAVEAALWSMLGERPVQVLAFENFGQVWAADVRDHLKLDPQVGVLRRAEKLRKTLQPGKKLKSGATRPRRSRIAKQADRLEIGHEIVELEKGAGKYWRSAPERDWTSIEHATLERYADHGWVGAAAEGEMLGLIFFSLLFGYFMIRIDHKRALTLQSFWEGVFEVMMHITMLVMKFAPLGVFALVAKTVIATGFTAFKLLLVFFFTVVLALGLHAFVTLALLLRYVAKVNPMDHYRAMFPAMLTAFSTASSSATLPLTIRCVENNAGVSNKTSSFVLPLGATINMDGTALYECVAAIFIAQAYGLDLSFAQQFLIVALALLTSIGVAGIPAASLVAISVILTAMGLPLEGIGLLLVTDRVLDMLRTAVNVFSDSCCAVIVAKLEGEKGLFKVAR